MVASPRPCCAREAAPLALPPPSRTDSTRTRQQKQRCCAVDDHSTRENRCVLLTWRFSEDQFSSPASSSRFEHAGSASGSRPGDCVVALVEGERLRLAGCHPAEEVGGVAHPPDVGHERDLLPAPEMLDAHLQVLPERAPGKTVEVAHYDHDS